MQKNSYAVIGFSRKMAVSTDENSAQNSVLHDSFLLLPWQLRTKAKKWCFCGRISDRDLT